MKSEVKSIIDAFQKIIKVCDETTTQNILEQMTYIVGICGSMAYKVNNQYGKNILYCNLIGVIKLALETTPDNLAHKIATIKGLCLRNIDFLKEYGVE